MQCLESRFIFSASDLNDFLECEHLTELERLVALGEASRPDPDGTAALLSRKGDEHERRYLEGLRTNGSDVVVFRANGERSIDAWRAAEAQTLAAMEGGARIIYQATFFDGVFLGRADFLRRVERPSAAWPWSYEVIDTKLALSPKPYYLVQLCNYSEHVNRLQGVMPREMHVVLGNREERHFRVDDFVAYYRNLKVRFLGVMAKAPHATYPFETAHCVICPWRSVCARRRDDDDHLSLVANIRRDHIARLEASGIRTVAELAECDRDRRPYGMVDATFDKLHAQAQLQHVYRTQRRHVYELLDHDAETGFGLLPEPSPGDLFFDIEGDPLYAPERGLEYLFGLYLSDEDRYVAFWARTDREEQAAFEALIDFLVERRRTHPGMHIYHYASYETTALRRLMGFYAARERELDDLLRNEVFVDLYTVVRQSLRISQPSYSLKKLETFYGMRRETNVQRGDDSIVMFESWLASGDDSILHDIERYNEDDCRSTHRLREWLLERRTEWAREYGRTPNWHEPRHEELRDDDGRDEVAKRLLDGLLPPRSLAELRGSAESVRARWLLGHLLDYHAREAKPAYWQLYDRYGNTDRLLEFDHEAIAGLRLCPDVAPEKLKQSYVYTYDFPEQQHNLGTSTPYSPHHKCVAGTIVELDDDGRRLRIKLSRAIQPDTLHALIPGKPMENQAQRRALGRLAGAYLDETIETRFPASYSMLLARAPRFVAPRSTVQPRQVDACSVSEIIGSLNRSHLVVQGPPGSGKSTIGAQVIVDLVQRGKRIGILANGHKAIHNLLSKVERTAHERGIRFRGVQKYSNSNEGSRYVSPLAEPMIVPVPDNAELLARPHELAAGTPWLFSREGFAGAYDYLFVDEAGQISLGDALACSTAAQNVVLLGDPLQLAQVSQGAHPLGTDLSVLEHLLLGDETIDPACGVFLDVSYRMHPEICAFISHAVYEDRLRPAAGCERNRVDSPGLGGSGLRYLPVTHHNNYRESAEEADAIVAAIADLLQGSVTVGNRAARRLAEADVLIVSPYNAQRTRIRQRLATAGFDGVRVGTVDKFQGQEAPVVFYSMATSSGATLPRDLEFLFEKNRLNVAISRAQCLTVLVCSPALLELHCKTPDEMALVNLLCAYVETTSLPG